jgi:subtilisin family serine protease
MEDAMASGSKLWSVFSLGSAIAGAAVTKKVLNTSWRAATGKNPPANPADPDVAMREAVVWAVASGAAIQVVRMLATRRAAGYYLRSTGHLPPELKKDDQHADKASAPTW